MHCLVFIFTFLNVFIYNLLYIDITFIVQPTQNHSFTSVVSEQVPVRLTPAWEENNLPNDELNFKSLSMDDAVLETDPPKDR